MGQEINCQFIGSGPPPSDVMDLARRIGLKNPNFSRWVYLNSTTRIPKSSPPELRRPCSWCLREQRRKWRRADLRDVAVADTRESTPAVTLRRFREATSVVFCYIGQCDECESINWVLQWNPGVD